MFAGMDGRPSAGDFGGGGGGGSAGSSPEKPGGGASAKPIDMRPAGRREGRPAPPIDGRTDMRLLLASGGRGGGGEPNDIRLSGDSGIAGGCAVRAAGGGGGGASRRWRRRRAAPRALEALLKLLCRLLCVIRLRLAVGERRLHGKELVGQRRGDHVVAVALGEGGRRRRRSASSTTTSCSRRRSAKAELSSCNCLRSSASACRWLAIVSSAAL